MRTQHFFPTWEISVRFTGMWRGKVIKPDEGADCKCLTAGFTLALLTSNSVFGEEALAYSLILLTVVKSLVLLLNRPICQPLPVFKHPAMPFTCNSTWNRKILSCFSFEILLVVYTSDQKFVQLLPSDKLVIIVINLEGCFACFYSFHLLWWRHPYLFQEKSLFSLFLNCFSFAFAFPPADHINFIICAVIIAPAKEPTLAGSYPR